MSALWEGEERPCVDFTEHTWLQSSDWQHRTNAYSFMDRSWWCENVYSLSQWFISLWKYGNLFPPILSFLRVYISQFWESGRIVRYKHAILRKSQNCELKVAVIFLIFYSVAGKKTELWCKLGFELWDKVAVNFSVYFTLFFKIPWQKRDFYGKYRRIPHLIKGRVYS